MKNCIQIIPIYSIPEITTNLSLEKLISDGIKKNDITLLNKDIVVVTQKMVSKAEGNVIHLKNIQPSKFAISIALASQKDPRYIEIVLQESKRIVRMDHNVLITETHHGFICANSGVDASNMATTNTVSVLPKNPNKSAQLLREKLKKRWGCEIAIIISDSWGRPWREGQVNFAIGSSGITPFQDYRGFVDSHGYELKASVIAIGDEIAGAAELVMGKTSNIPVAIVRGYQYTRSESNAELLLRNPSVDMFR